MIDEPIVVETVPWVLTSDFSVSIEDEEYATIALMMAIDMTVPIKIPFLFTSKVLKNCLKNLFQIMRWFFLKEIYKFGNGSIYGTGLTQYSRWMLD